MKKFNVVMAMIIAGLMVIPVITMTDESSAATETKEFELGHGPISLLLNRGEATFKLVQGERAYLNDGMSIYTDLNGRGSSFAATLKDVTIIRLNGDSGAKVSVSANFADSGTITEYGKTTTMSKSGGIYCVPIDGKEYYSIAPPKDYTTWIFETGSTDESDFLNKVKENLKLPDAVSSKVVLERDKNYHVYCMINSNEDNYWVYLNIEKRYTGSGLVQMMSIETYDARHLFHNDGYMYLYNAIQCSFQSSEEHWLVEAGSAEESKLKDDFNHGIMPVPSAVYEIDDSKSYNLYMVKNEASSYYESYNYTYIENWYDNFRANKVGSYGVDDGFKFFITGHSSFTISVSEPGISMSSGSDSTLFELVPDTIYRIENVEAREYKLVYAKGDDAGTLPVNVDLQYNLDGVPESDSMGPAFSVASILLCVAVFSLLFLAGRKPSWSKD